MFFFLPLLQIMRVERIVLLLLLVFSGFVLEAQKTEKDKVNEVLRQRGEARIIVKATSEELQRVSEVASLDYKQSGGWLVYVNQRQFETFCSLGLDYTLFEPNDTKAVDMATTIEQMQSWNRYPTFGVYCDIMLSLSEYYPDLCRLDTIGESVMGRKILALRLTENSTETIGKPKYFYSSSIHGDELTGMVMLLRLADSLLSNYRTNAEIRELLSSVELFICPLANPDGAYKGGNNTVRNATRYNANYVDLNRNFPDPVLGENNDNEAYQRETTAFMDYAKRERFDLAANMHGGAEVCNYPWDCWNGYEQQHSDKAWFESVCLRFVEDVRTYSPSDYFTDVSQDGVINGGDWYVVYGGRQDYHTYYLSCREITLEISTIKTPSSSTLPLYWSYLGNALANLADDATKGVHGIVKDSLSGERLDSVKVELQNAQGNGSEVYSKADGYYFRALSEGVYDLKFSKNGYEDKTISLTAHSDSLVRFDVMLKKTDVSLSGTEQEANWLNVYPNPCSERLFVQSLWQGEYEITGSLGIVVLKGKIEKGRTVINMAELPNGIYVLRIDCADLSSRKAAVRLIKQKVE